MLTVNFGFTLDGLYGRYVCGKIQTVGRSSPNLWRNFRVKGPVWNVFSMTHYKKISDKCAQNWSKTMISIAYNDCLSRWRGFLKPGSVYRFLKTSEAQYGCWVSISLVGIQFTFYLSMNSKKDKQTPNPRHDDLQLCLTKLQFVWW